MHQGDAHFTAPQLAINLALTAAPGVAECAVFPSLGRHAPHSARRGDQFGCRDFDVYTRCAPITFCTHAPCGNGRRGRVRSGRGNRRSQFGRAPRPPSSPLRKKAVSACWQAKALHVQGSTVRGRGSYSSGTVGVSCMNGSYLSQSTCQCARHHPSAPNRVALLLALVFVSTCAESCTCWLGPPVGQTVVRGRGSIPRGRAAAGPPL